MNLNPHRILMKRAFLLLMLISTVAAPSAAQQSQNTEAQTTATFRFLPEDDMFYLSVYQNQTELERLFDFVDRYKSDIASGRAPVYVTSYSAAFGSARENLNSAKIRANRVKSELIEKKGLAEESFLTENKAQRYLGQSSAVVVEITVPAKPAPAPAPQPRPQPVPQPRPEPAPQPQPQPRPEPAPAPAPVVYKPWSEPYLFALRTNLLHDLLLLPTLGVEWRVTRGFGIKVDGSWSKWDNDNGKVQKIWLVSPELRWYMGHKKRFYLGLGGNIGDYNVYGGMIGSFFPDDTGYQGNLYSGGITVGYQAKLARHLFLDFNIGGGMTRFKYDSFGLVDGVRTYKMKNQTKNFWGPTQAGVSLVWTIGRNNYSGIR